jgi:hypothetical protein
MAKRILVLLVLSLTLLIAPSWGATCTQFVPGNPCTNVVSPADTTAIYEFGSQGRLVVQFETLLTTFSLTVTTSNPSNTTLQGELDPNEFPSGTSCVQYPSADLNTCIVYSFTGSGTTGNGPNGVPVKNIDYQGLITLTLSYFTFQTVHTPAFGHAPGDITTFTENILTSYSANPVASDPTMSGKTPGLSSVVALDEPLTSSNTGCPLTLTPTNNPSGQKPEVEVTMKIVSGTDCTATGLRDKTASLSVSMTDSAGNESFPALKNTEGNKFHWDNKNGLNEYDISLEGLSDGQYTATAFSSKVSPESADFCVANGTATLGTCP